MADIFLFHLDIVRLNDATLAMLDGFVIKFPIKLEGNAVSYNESPHFRFILKTASQINLSQF